MRLGIGLHLRGRQNRVPPGPDKILGSKMEVWSDCHRGDAVFDSGVVMETLEAKATLYPDYRWTTISNPDKPNLHVVPGKMNNKRVLELEGIDKNQEVRMGSRLYNRFNLDGVSPLYRILIMQTVNDPSAASNEAGLDDYTGNSQQNYYRDVDDNLYVNFMCDRRHSIGKIPHNLAMPHMFEQLSENGRFYAKWGGIKEFETALNGLAAPFSTAILFQSNGATIRAYIGQMLILNDEPTLAELELIHVWVNWLYKAMLPEKITPPASLPLVGNLRVLDNGINIFKIDMGAVDLNDTLAPAITLMDGFTYDMTDGTLWVTREFATGDQVWNIHPVTGAILSSFGPLDFGELDTIAIENICPMPDGTLLVLGDDTNQGDIWHVNRNGSLIQNIDLTALTINRYTNFVRSPQGLCTNSRLGLIAIVDNATNSIWFFDFNFNFVREVKLTGIVPADITYDAKSKMYFIVQHTPPTLFLVDGLGVTHATYSLTGMAEPTGVAVVP